MSAPSNALESLAPQVRPEPVVPADPATPSQSPLSAGIALAERVLAHLALPLPTELLGDMAVHAPADLPADVADEWPPTAEQVERLAGWVAVHLTRLRDAGDATGEATFRVEMADALNRFAATLRREDGEALRARYRREIALAAPR